MLLGRSRANCNQSCVFTDLANCLHTDAASLLASMRPAADAPLETAKQAYAAMTEYLLESFHWAVPVSQHSFCLAHKRMCPLHPGYALLHHHSLAAAEAAATKDANPMPELEQACEHTPAWWAAESLRKSFPILQNKDGQMLKDPQHRPLIVNVSGIICVDFTPLGHKLREGGTSAYEHALFLANRAALGSAHMEDLFFSECAAAYPSSEKQRPLSKYYTLVGVCTGPEYLGFPSKRCRSLAAGINLSTLVWVGPEPDDIQDDFNRMFHRSLQLSADVFFNATVDEVFMDANVMAASRNRALSENHRQQSMSEYLDLLVPPFNVSAKGEYEDYFASLSLKPPFYADLDHHPGRGPRCGSTMPTMDTHPRIYGWTEQRLATPLELLTVQGIDMPGPLLGNRSESPLVRLFRGLKRHQQLHLVGNGMHVPTMSAWFLYVCSHCRKRSDFFALPSQISSRIDGSDDEL